MGPLRGVASKALPARPASSNRERDSVLLLDDDDMEDEVVIVQTATTARIGTERSDSQAGPSMSGLGQSQPSLRSRYQDSRFGSDSHQEPTRPEPPFLQSAFSR